jgi:hemolysin III
MSQENWPIWGLRDPVSSMTHFGAFLLAILGTLLLWRLCRGARLKQLAMGCFGLSMMTLYAASTVYHALRLPPGQLQFFRLMDQSAIYGLIAGTYTPVLLVVLRPRLRQRLLLGGVWVLAVAGVVCKWSLASEPFGLTIGLYFGIGWLALLPIGELTRSVGFPGIAWAVWGGVCYTLGGVADLIDWPRFSPGYFGAHELSHVFDMAGTFCHFVFVFRYVVPFPAHAPRARPERPAVPSSACGLA